ncbi:unnamed protein product [Rotaria sordida]|uniref:Uncharacterized protein n=1 Tax=Rotaria sordida TaxID=392033 RepID=A0A818TTR5_9BILA|nr:unnamed protein product [Rotaria sordida]CAF3688538.1 unnamed protein product [Rotaria sordida]
MSDPNRSVSRWSTSMSVTTKSTNNINQTTPLVILRRKLFRQSTNQKKLFSQRMAKSKHNIEELFKLYYSNDVKFDTFQRQIVTGTRIPTTQISPLLQDNLATNSTNVFDAKHCVSREQWNSLDLDSNEEQKEQQQQPTNNEITTAKSSSTKRSVQIRTSNNTIINHPVPSSNPSPCPPKVIPILPNPPQTSSSTQQEDLCDSSFIKSVTFLGDISNEAHESIHKKRSQSKITQRSKSSKSSLLTIPPQPSLVVTNANNRKDPTVLSNTSFSTVSSSQQKSNRSATVTSSAVIVRQRSPTKLSRTRQRTNLDTTMTTVSSLSQSTTKPRSPSICSPLSIESSDIPELPVFVGGQRVVSIPSKCSRYVLVTFPETPLRYNAPSYVERLLLPERFPTLFQNIVQSYDPHLTNEQPSRNTK